MSFLKFNIFFFFFLYHLEEPPCFPFLKQNKYFALAGSGWILLASRKKRNFLSAKNKLLCVKVSHSQRHFREERKDSCSELIFFKYTSQWNVSNRIRRHWQIGWEETSNVFYSQDSPNVWMFICLSCLQCSWLCMWSQNDNSSPKVISIGSRWF